MMTYILYSPLLF